MTMDNGASRPDFYNSREAAGALARLFSGIASHIYDGKTEEAKAMALSLAREFSRIAAEQGGEWKPLTDAEYLAGLDESRRRQAEMQERWARTNPVSVHTPVAYVRGQF